jgi:DNA-binding CsgD family transcriptional regulator
MSVLADLVTAVRAGESRVLVLPGEPGLGKTALLDYLAGQAQGCRVVRTAGVQSEMEIAFGGLHQLLAPMMDNLGQLPSPQRDALRTVFGFRPGPAPDHYLVSLGVLSLLLAVAGERPLVCLVDDQQWLDRASAQALGFAARRLVTSPVGLVFATRVTGEELARLPELAVSGLAEADAKALLDSALTGPLDAQVRDQIVAEARGNPLALLELPRGVTSAELAGGFRLPVARSLTGRIEDSFQRRLDALPAPTRRLLLLAAADPSGDASLVWRAADQLGLPIEASMPAVEADLAEFGARVRFRHPLVRSVAYRSAPFKERRLVHKALAEATDPVADPDRRAWHRAQAADGPDEEAAAELERSAGRARARGGLAAAAAFLERSVQLTVDPARHSERTLAAAQASVQAGVFEKAMKLLVIAEAGPLGALPRARLDLLRGQIAFSSGMAGDAAALLLKAARRLEPLDLGLARETYLDAWAAATFARQPAAGAMAEICRAARALPRSPHPGRLELLLDGLALQVTDGPAAAAPTLLQAVSAFSGDSGSADNGPRWGWLATIAAHLLWDDHGFWSINARQVQLTRDAGALDRLPNQLEAAGLIAAWSGDLETADSLIAESRAVGDATGARVPFYAGPLLSCLRGEEAEATRLIDAAQASGHGITATAARWIAAVLGNSLGRYEQARQAAREAADDPAGYFVSLWALPELVEAAVRTGDSRAAADALTRLAETTRAGGTEYGLGMEARCRALVGESRAAEDRYLEAIDRLGRTRIRVELARAHLLYGEWLRRENRRTDARKQLRTAHAVFDKAGMAAFAERARWELLATGETARKRGHQAAVGAGQELTPQEAQVAQLARSGLSNPEIGARLFISSHTVQYHLSKVFAKLGISSRGQLNNALPGS